MPLQLQPHDEQGELSARAGAAGSANTFSTIIRSTWSAGTATCIRSPADEDFWSRSPVVHQPPPVHQTFQGPNFVLCSFVPRLFDYHPQSIPAPYNHSNVESDEVIYYVEGNFMSRRGTGITQHPAGLPHGPHPH